MAIVIKWSDESKNTFEKNINYLEQEWSGTEIKNFISQTDYVLSKIVVQPAMYPASQKSNNVRRAHINKYIVLYYKYYPVKRQIVLLTFWHTNQNPNKLNY